MTHDEVSVLYREDLVSLRKITSVTKGIGASRDVSVKIEVARSRCCVGNPLYAKVDLRTTLAKQTRRHTVVTSSQPGRPNGRAGLHVRASPGPTTREEIYFDDSSGPLWIIELVGKPLSALVTDEPETLSGYLRQCSQNSEGIQRSLNIRPANEHSITYSLLGGLVHQREELR